MDKNLSNLNHQLMLARISYDPRVHHCVYFPPPDPAPTEVTLFRRNEECTLVGNAIVHSYFILWIALSGEGNLLIDQNQFHPVAGEALLLFPGQPHLRLPQPGRKVEFLAVRFLLEQTPEWLEELRDRCFRMPPAAFEAAGRLARTYFAARREKSSPSVTLCATRLVELLQTLRQVGEADGRTGHPVHPCGISGERINAVCRALIASPHRSLAELAAENNVSEGHLRREFEHALGLTVKQFTDRYRCNRATRLLHHSELNIGEIARVCGFSSLYAFSRFFRHYTGQTPTQCRDERTDPRRRQ